MNTGLLLDAFICAVGLGLHFAMKWAESRQKATAAGKVPPGMGGYIAEVPAQSMVSILATVGAFTVTATMEWMNPGMAFACGYMGNSIAENLANKFAKA
jgi:hypothetical protein